MTEGSTAVADPVSARLRSPLRLPEQAEEMSPLLALETPVVVFMGFTVPADAADAWYETWRRIAHGAQRVPGCRSFYLTRSPLDTRRRGVCSEWTSLNAYHAFMRSSGLSHVQRSANPAFRPSSVEVLEIVAPDPAASRASMGSQLSSV